MTLQEARRIADGIIIDYRVNYHGAPFPYDLDEVYENAKESAFSDDPSEIASLIQIFAEHIMIYHSPLYQALKED